MNSLILSLMCINAYACACVLAEQIAPKDWASIICKEALAGLGAGTLTCVAVVPLLRIMKISIHVYPRLEGRTKQAVARRSAAVLATLLSRIL